MAIHTQKLRNERSRNSHQHKVLSHQTLEAYVREKIGLSWSPEQISGSLAIDHLLDSRMRVSYGTIYKFIYATEQAEEKLWEYLPRKQTKRRKKPGIKVSKSHIPDRVAYIID